MVKTIIGVAVAVVLFVIGVAIIASLIAVANAHDVMAQNDVQ